MKAVTNSSVSLDCWETGGTLSTYACRMTDDCLFCKIIRGEIPANEVASTETAFAFRDIDPKAPTHVLVVPREHVADADHLEPRHGSLLIDVFSLAREVAAKEGLSPSHGGNGFRLVLNVGDDAGNTVPHLHLHVLGGRSLTWPAG